MIRRHFFKSGLIIATVFLLSACQAPRVFIGEDVTVVRQGLLETEHVFVRATSDASLSEEDVYRVDNEFDLAILVILNNLDQLRPVTYISELDLSLNKVFALVETVLPYSFTLQLFTKNFALNDEEVLRLHEMRILPSYVDVLTLNQTMDLAHMTWVGFERQGLDAIATIHDELILNTAYDESVLDLDLSVNTTHPAFEAYGLVRDGLAVCSGYARAFNALALRSGVPSIMFSALNMQHAFNLVYDGEQWVFIDVTFNDPIPDRPGRVLRTFYLLDEADFLALGEHRFDEGEYARLTPEEYYTFAYALFPQTRPQN